MTYVPQKMGSILIPTRDGPDSKHLHVILTNKDANNRHLLVNVTSIENDVYYDPACELPVGCHRFINKPTYVLYEMGATVHSAHLIKLVDARDYVPHDDFDEPVFQLICNGVEKSRAPRWFKKDYAAAVRAGL